MRRWTIFVCSAVAVAIVVVVLLGRGRLAALPKAPNSERGPLSIAVIGVKKLMQNVGSYRAGIVLVEGVVSKVDSDNDILALIDTSEFQECGDITCAPLTLPVRWSGTMPHERECVRVKGVVQETGDKLVFVAQAVEKVALTSSGPR